MELEPLVLELVRLRQDLAQINLDSTEGVIGAVAIPVHDLDLHHNAKVVASRQGLAQVKLLPCK